jgi:hypothetical protein
MAPARVACAWRARDRASSSAAPRVREYLRLREILTRELNVCASKRASHAMAIRCMRRVVPEGSLVDGPTKEELRSAPEEFWTLEFKNPTRRSVVARGAASGDGRGGGDDDRANEDEVKGTYTCDEDEVGEFLASSATRFHRAAQSYVVAGDAFDAGDFNVKICRVETSSGQYVGTILDLSYRATNDARTASAALREFAAHATATANAAAESDDDLGDFVLKDLRESCPLRAYRAPAGDLQCAISYVDAVRALL